MMTWAMGIAVAFAVITGALAIGIALAATNVIRHLQGDVLELGREYHKRLKEHDQAFNEMAKAVIGAAKRTQAVDARVELIEGRVAAIAALGAERRH